VNNQMIILGSNYQQAVEEFYRQKRGSNPDLREALAYLDEEASEFYATVEDDIFRVISIEDVDRKHFAKEAADLMFTLYGVAITVGVDLDEAFRLVAESNMTKQKTPEGKVIKGPDYIEPNMESALL
jgi:NTP pyrophosphatase (non-canonical NTP hydrolase)